MKYELEQIAEKAAREYEMNTRNEYFSTRPEELHKVLVSIILGAHELIKRADTEAQDSPNILLTRAGVVCFAAYGWPGWASRGE